MSTQTPLWNHASMVRQVEVDVNNKDPKRLAQETPYDTPKL